MNFVRLLFTTLLWITVVNTTSSCVTPRPQDKESIKSFSQWCKQKLTLTKKTKHTVEVLLQKAGTNDCLRASQELNKQRILDLRENKISDIKPLAALTNLTQLDLGENKISDIKPLAALTNLNQLSISFNQISDVKPLAELTNLTQLYLGANQISDVKPLAELTNLTQLNLGGNPIKNTTCPVKPESICNFKSQALHL